MVSRIYVNWLRVFRSVSHGNVVLESIRTLFGDRIEETKLFSGLVRHLTHLGTLEKWVFLRLLEDVEARI